MTVPTRTEEEWEEFFEGDEFDIAAFTANPKAKKVDTKSVDRSDETEKLIEELERKLGEKSK